MLSVATYRNPLRQPDEMYVLGLVIRDRRLLLGRGVNGNHRGKRIGLTGRVRVAENPETAMGRIGLERAKIVVTAMTHCARKDCWLAVSNGVRYESQLVRCEVFLLDEFTGTLRSTATWADRRWYPIDRLPQRQLLDDEHILLSGVIADRRQWLTFRSDGPGSLALRTLDTLSAGR